MSAWSTLLRGSGVHPRSGALAGRLLRVLDELGLVVLDSARLAVAVPPAVGRSRLERSAAFRASSERLQDGLAHLAERTPAATQRAPEVAAA